MLRRITRVQATVDVAIALSLAVLLGIPSLLLTTDLEVVAVAVLLVTMGVLVGARRVAPLPALIGGLLLGAAFVGFGLTALTPIWLQLLVLLYGVGRYGDALQRLLGGVVALVGAVLVGVWFSSAPGFGGSVGDVARMLLGFAIATVGFALLFGLALLVGILVGEIVRSRSLARETRQERERAEVEQERTGIARDMHDVVAHSLAVVIAQANGARYAASTEAKDESLAQISQTASSALGDVRALLERLRHAQAPDPDASMANLDALLTRVRAAGLRVELHERGQRRPLPRAVDIAAYRIVQEALTNALRHGARTHPVIVSLSHGPWLEVVVRNALREAPRPSGHGLVGMRERARIAGGQVQIGPHEGAWVVRAMLPTWEATR